MKQIEGGWTRTCPQCVREVAHKTKNKCRFAEKHGKVCSACNRSNVGSANARVDDCPLCGVKLALSRTLKGQATLTKHASSHDVTSETLYMLKHNVSTKPSCVCGCGETVSWHGWWEGYSDFVIGHSANIESESAKVIRLAAVRESFASGKSVGWSKGLTKETDERVLARAEATSMGRKEAFNVGKIVIWSKGLTKETDLRVKAAAEALANKFSMGVLEPWAKGLTKETDERVLAMATKVSLTHHNVALRSKLDSAKRLTVDEIRERVERNGNLTFIRLKGEYINYLQQNVMISCNVCGSTWDDCVKRLDSCRCFKCDPAGSRAQSEISSWIMGFREHVTVNDRKWIGGLELDIFDKDALVGIEYNSHYYHNITKKSSTYHQLKSDRCIAAGIKLFHVFEDEWRDKRPIVESMISHRLGVTGRKINARSCLVKRLNSKERKTFFERNHIDGDVKSSAAFGLMMGDEIVAAMSLRNPFHKKYSSHTEIARTCNVLGANVRGALSKLTNVVKTYCESTSRPRLMTYIDTRFGSMSKSWEVAGWSFDSATAVRWWWTDFHDRYNRFKYRADKTRGLTEDQVAEEAGVVKIYGCRNLLYTIG